MFNGYDKMGQPAVAQALDYSIRDKESRREQMLGGGYEQGSPVKKAGEEFKTRFAGDELIGQMNGEFGRVAMPQPGEEKPQSPNFPNVERFMKAYLSGMFGPGLGGPEEQGPPPTEKKA